MYVFLYFYGRVQVDVFCIEGNGSTALSNNPMFSPIRAVQSYSVQPS